jgi:hypothetical protein
MAVKVIAPIQYYEITPKSYQITQELVHSIIKKTTGPSGEVSPQRFHEELENLYPSLSREDSVNILRSEGRYNAALDRRKQDVA